MAERKAEATAYFSSEVSHALDVISSAMGVTRSEYVSSVLIDHIARKVDEANVLAAAMAGKRIARSNAE